MSAPSVELPCTVYDEDDHVWLDISFPPRVRMEWLLDLYILRYDQEPFSVTLAAERRIAARIITRPGLERPGRAEWGQDRLVLILETEELDYWLHMFRRWYRGVWDMYTAPHYDVTFDREQSNLPRGFGLLLEPGTDRDAGRGPKSAKRRRGKHR